MLNKSCVSLNDVDVCKIFAEKGVGAASLHHHQYHRFLVKDLLTQIYAISDTEIFTFCV